MSEITQRRFMYKLIRCLMDKAAQPDRCEWGEIVDEILKIEDNPFEKGLRDSPLRGSQNWIVTDVKLKMRSCLWYNQFLF